MRSLLRQPFMNTSRRVLTSQTRRYANNPIKSQKLPSPSHDKPSSWNWLHPALQAQAPTQVKVFNSLEEFFGVPSFDPQAGIDPVRCSEIGVHLDMGFHDREDIIQQIQKAVEQVLASPPKSKNELVVLHGVPGSGKTKSFEALLQTAILPDLFTVGVTFNSSMSIDDLERKILTMPGSSLSDLLGIRLLCVLSRVLNKPMGKEDVCRLVDQKLLELKMLSPELICQKILAVSQKKHLLLLVDEPLSLVTDLDAGRQNLVDFFSKACSYQDTEYEAGSRIVVVFSALLRNIFDGSHRPLNFIPLPALPLKTCEEILQPYSSAMETIFRPTDRRSVEMSWVALLAKLSGGHPRTLEIFINILNPLKGQDHPRSLSSFLDRVRTDFKRRYNIAEEKTIYYREGVLLSFYPHPLPNFALINGSTLDQHIQTGSLLSYYRTGSTEIRPRVSLLIIDIFSSVQPEKSEERELMQFLLHSGLSISTGGERFEMAFFTWERLMRKIRGLLVASTQALVDFLEPEPQGPQTSYQAMLAWELKKYKHVQKKGICYLPRSAQDKVQWSSALISQVYPPFQYLEGNSQTPFCNLGAFQQTQFNFTTPLGEKMFVTVRDINDTSCLWFPQDTNWTGFDCLVPLYSADMQSFVWLAIENKYSDEGSTTKLSWTEDLIANYKQAKKKLKPLNAPFIYILLAYRTTPCPRTTTNAIPKDAQYLVVDEKGCEKLFGQTLIDIIRR